MFAYLLFSDDNTSPSDGLYVDLDVDEWLATQVVILAMEGPM